jgi:hypothetical protein
LLQLATQKQGHLKREQSMHFTHNFFLALQARLAV